MTELFQDRKIDNQIADRDSDARVVLFRLKDAEREILDGKMRILCDLDELTKRHAYHLTTKITENTKSYFNLLLSRTSCPSW